MFSGLSLRQEKSGQDHVVRLSRRAADLLPEPRVGGVAGLQGPVLGGVGIRSLNTVDPEIRDLPPPLGPG